MEIVCKCVGICGEICGEICWKSLKICINLFLKMSKLAESFFEICRHNNTNSTRSNETIKLHLPSNTKQHQRIIWKTTAPSQNNDMQLVIFFGHAQMCLWWVYKAHVSVFTCSWIANTLRPLWSERHLPFAQSTPMAFITIYDTRCYCHCRTGSPLCITQPREF